MIERRGGTLNSRARHGLKVSAALPPGLDLKRVLSRVEALTGVKLPGEVIEASIVPGEGVLHLRFREPRGLELGEPLHPKIHLYRDKDTGEVTAIEIIDPEEL
jgi:hypothetical protein